MLHWKPIMVMVWTLLSSWWEGWHLTVVDFQYFISILSLPWNDPVYPVSTCVFPFQISRRQPHQAERIAWDRKRWTSLVFATRWHAGTSCGKCLPGRPVSPLVERRVTTATVIQGCGPDRSSVRRTQVSVNTFSLFLILCLRCAPRHFAIGDVELSEIYLTVKSWLSSRTREYSIKLCNIFQITSNLFFISTEKIFTQI